MKWKIIKLMEKPDICSKSDKLKVVHFFSEAWEFLLVQVTSMSTWVRELTFTTLRQNPRGRFSKRQRKTVQTDFISLSNQMDVSFQVST